MQYTFVQKAKIVTGAGAVSRLGELICDAGYRKPFLVIDPFILSSGMADAAIQGLKDLTLEYVIFDKIIPNPPSEHIDEGGRLCKAAGCDCVVAIGGGSCIDTAKGVNILRFNEGSILDYAKDPDKMELSPGLITVPTTAGTGSELSDGLIVTDVAAEAKVPVLAVKGMSEYVIVDPVMTVGAPRSLTISAGLDVFSHAFEGYTSCLANPICDPVVEKIMEMVVQNLPVAVEHPDDLKARTAMSVAATMAGWMLANVSTYVGHSLAHVLGAKMHMVHGEACAYGLPGVMEFISDVASEKLIWVGRLLGVVWNGDESAEEIGAATAAAYKQFRDHVLGLRSVKEYSADESLIGECVREILAEPFAGNTPKPLTAEDVETLVRKALDI